MANAPLTALSIAQVGLETTRGTAVPATAILDMDPYGARINRDPSIIRVRKAGSLATGHFTYPGQDKISVEVSAPVSYNWLPWWFNLFLGPLASGTGAGADKTWTFDSSIVSDSSDNLKSATFEVGGTGWPSEYQVAGCVGQKLSFSIKQDQPWMLKASLFGTAVTAQAKTNSLSAVSSIVHTLGTTTKLYFDTSSAFGTTQRVGTVLSADIDIELGTSARYTLDGQRNPYRIGVTGPRNISAKFVVEYNVQTEYTATNAGTAQRIRVVSTGASLGSSAYKAQIDIPGTYDSFVLGDDNGVITEELQLTAQYDSTPAADIAAVVVNASASLP